MTTYQLEPDLRPSEFIALLKTTTLGVRRPLADEPRINQMLQAADIVLTARIEGALVGVSRALTDFSYCTYLSDLAVHDSYQRQGIGRELIRRTHEIAGGQTALVLLAAPGAETYYPHVGMQPNPTCWWIDRES